jgi:ABC-type multidrug transport system ATPase subunit
MVPAALSILLHNTHHRFKDLLALDQVSLHVRRGDCYGFIGHNGAGKTTALRIALGLLRPDHGRIVIDGRDGSRDPRVRELVGGMIEHPGFHDNSSGSRNLDMLAGLQGIPASEREAEIERVLALVGLRGVGKKSVGQYSQGMRQRLGLAQALLGQPRYLILDEPTNGLDPQGIHELRVLLQELARETQVTILLSSHLLAEVAGLCNRVGVLHEGRLLIEAETEALVGGASHAHDLRTDDDPAATSILDASGVTVAESPDGGVRVTLDGSGMEPSDIVQTLVQSGRKVHRFAAVEISLEEIYLEYARGDRVAEPSLPHKALPPPEPDGPTTTSPPPSRTNGLIASFRVMRYELRRLTRPGPLLALLSPALLAPFVVYRRHLGAVRNAEDVAAGGPISTTDVTAFESLGRALQTTLPLLALIVAGMASQSIAAELRGGTLRNLLIRPFRRIEIVVGKLWVVATLALLAYFALLGSAALAAGIAFDYGDLVEILATGKPYPLLNADDVWPELWPAIASPVAPLLAFTALGFLCGTLTRSAAGALVLTLGTMTALELLRGLAGGYGVEHWLPGPYLPSPLAPQGSHLDNFVLVAGGVSTQPWIFAWIAPMVWLAVCGALAALAMRRKYVA